jgi:signal peptidase II
MAGDWEERRDALAAMGTASQKWALRGMGLAIPATITAVAELVSKQMVVAWLSEPPFGLTVTPFFNLRLSFNSGISFSFFQATTAEAVLSLVVLACAMVVALVWLGLRATGIVERVGYGLIIGGAVGNMIDRAGDGVVTDFLDFHAFGWHWPSFNLADVAIVGGVALLLVSQTTVFCGIQRTASSAADDT